MKTESNLPDTRCDWFLKPRSTFVMLILSAACLGTVSCRPGNGSGTNQADAPVDPLTFVLAPHSGDRPLDREIRALQEQLRRGQNPELTLEQLGWAFVAKARESFDAGFYKLAEQCALSLEARRPGGSEALLLRGHVLHSLHRFAEAEQLSRRLVEQRGLSFDHGLLGDVLMEQGKLSAAIQEYQQMIDLKPDLHAYARVAHVRWLKGDLTGAIQVMQLAVRAATPLDPESAAWVNTRLAGYEFQAGQFQPAERRCQFALSLQTNYAPALLLRGRLRLAANQTAEAVELLQTAAQLNPLPEYQWTLAEALRTAGREAEAIAVERDLRRHGSASDPRTFALFLATRRESRDAALSLARAEFGTRSDVFTHDALAWSLAAAGRLPEAETEIERALAEGTEDGRLFFHAALIAAQSGRTTEARRRFERANALKHLLLPSERERLRALAPQLALATPAQPLPADKNFSALHD